MAVYSFNKVMNTTKMRGAETTHWYLSCLYCRTLKSV